MEHGTGAFAAALARVGPADAVAMAEAVALDRRLTKPAGALGRLEALGAQLCGIAGTCPPPLPTPAAVAVFAGDHGVVAEGVTPWPQEVTAQMVANFCAGGAAINVLARQTGARVLVVDVGVASPLEPRPGLAVRKVAAGTGDLATGPAMTIAQATAALDVGAEVAAELVADGAAAPRHGRDGDRQHHPGRRTDRGLHRAVGRRRDRARHRGRRRARWP